MDRAKAKKIRNIRVIATNIFMSISVVAIVFVLMLIAMGFTFNESGGLEQAGLAQIVSHPSGANVEIDGNNQISRTEFSKMLSAGKHKIRISKSGYDTWEKDLKIDAGLLTRVEWVRLFPKHFESNEVLNFDNLQFASFSADRKHLLALEKDSSTLKYIDIQADQPRSNDLSLKECLNGKNKLGQNSTFSIISWNDDNSKVIAKLTTDDKSSWHIINLNHPDRSVNLTQKFNLDFESILIANDSASKLWVLENGNLRIIDVDNLTISGSIASNILKIAHNKNVASFINYEEKINDKNEPVKEYRLNVFKEGEQGYTTVADLSNINDETVFRLTMGTYWSEEWLAYSVDEQLVIISGKYPSYEKDKASSLKERLNHKLGFTPQLASVNANQRILILTGDESMFSYDLETKDSYSIKIASKLTNITWLDDYLLWQNIDNTIVTRDFDGDNRREIVPNVSNPFPAVISENNRYLYYFDMTETESVTEGTDSPSDADPTTNTEKNLKYILKRQKLEI